VICFKTREELSGKIFYPADWFFDQPGFQIKFLFIQIGFLIVVLRAAVTSFQIQDLPFDQSETNFYKY
jgi:hypothetical protein